MREERGGEDGGKEGKKGGRKWLLYNNKREKLSDKVRQIETLKE